MAIETALQLHIADRPGEFARVTRQLADAGVNIRSVVGLTGGGEGVVEFLVDNLGAATQALQQGGNAFTEVRRVVSPIPQEVIDHPGSLARLAEALAGAGINVEALYAAIGADRQFLGVLGCSDPEKAESIFATWGA